MQKLQYIQITHNIHLAPIHLEDATRLAEIGNDSEITKNMNDSFPHPYTLQDAYARITVHSKPDDPLQHNYAIYIDNLYAGNIGWHKQKDRMMHNYHLGYRIGREYWGKGIMTTIIQNMIKHIFSIHEDCHKIYARVYDRNMGSQKVLEKSGFKREAELREAIYRDGGFHSEYMYGILRNEKTS